MAIRATNRAEFIRRLSLRNDLERWVGKEVEWFVDAQRNIIGTIAIAARYEGWNYVVLAKNRLGKFQAASRRENLFSLDEAREDCLHAMETDCTILGLLSGTD
jgi:hypothetical protein